MWTEEHRRICRREDDGYPNNLRDAEWARLEPMIPPARASGRCGFGQGTFAQASGNDEDAPVAVIYHWGFGGLGPSAAPAQALRVRGSWASGGLSCGLPRCPDPMHEHNRGPVQMMA
jgi:hypothetical protein